MTAITTDKAVLTGFHSLRGGRWGITLQLPALPPALVPAIQDMHHGQPVSLTVVPHDASDLFLQAGAESKREAMTESRRNKLAVQRLWAALGCPGTLEEFYAVRSAAWREQLENEAKTNGGEL